MKSIKISLAWQILIALVLGILVGAVLHNQIESREWLVSNILSPAGDIFIRLIKMIVVPIVISTLIVGIAGVGDAKKLGRIGLKPSSTLKLSPRLPLLSVSLWRMYSSRGWV